MNYDLEVRTLAIRADGCFSALLWQGRPFAVSCERTFGEENRVIIPAGLAVCKRTFYNRGGYPTYEIIVRGHTRVLFHKGNKEEDSEACVLVAESFTVLDGRTAVGDSKGGFNELMQLAGDQKEFHAFFSDR